MIMKTKLEKDKENNWGKGDNNTEGYKFSAGKEFEVESVDGNYG